MENYTHRLRAEVCKNGICGECAESIIGGRVAVRVLTYPIIVPASLLFGAFARDLQGLYQGPQNLDDSFGGVAVVPQVGDCAFLVIAVHDLFVLFENHAWI